MIEHGRVQHLVEASLSIPDDEDKYLVDKLGEMSLELRESPLQGRCLFLR